MSFVLSWKFLVMVKREFVLGWKFLILHVFLEKIANLIASENLNIERTIVAPKNDTVLRVELQVEGEVGIEQLKEVFVEAGFTVTEIAKTEAKELD